MKRNLCHVVMLLGLVTSLACADKGSTAQPAERIRPTQPTQPAAQATGHVRALHVAPEAPALALTYDDGRPMADAIVFGGSVDVDMPTGDHSFTVAVAGAGTIMATDDDTILEDDSSALVVWGDLTEMNATLIADATEPGYRVMNAVAGGRALGIDDGTNRATLTHGTLSASSTGDGKLRLDVDGDGATDATYTLPPLSDGDSGAVDIFCVGAGTAVSGTGTGPDATTGGAGDTGGAGTGDTGGAGAAGDTGGAGAGDIVVVASTAAGLVVIPADGPVPAARIRAIHLSPNAPDVDVFVNGGAALTGLPFESASPYASLPAGRYDLDVAPAGAGIGASVLAVHGLDLPAARSFSAVAFGELPGIQALALEDDLRPTAPGKIRVRAAHTADGVGQVDVLAIGAGDATKNDNNSAVFNDVDFGSVTPYIEIDAAAVQLGLDLDNDLVPELVFDVPALPVGTVATLFAVIDADGVALFAALGDGSTAVIRGAAPTPPAAPANVRVVHLAPEAPAVAVNANGARIVDTLSFLNATQFAQVPSGRTDLDVALATAPDAAVLSAVGELAPESFTTAVAFGRLDDLRVLTLPEDRSAPSAGNIRVRAVHTAIGLGDVDVYANGALVVNDLPFGAASDSLEVPAGAYVIGLDLDEDAHADLEFQLPHLPAGSIANLFAVVDAHGNASLAIEN